MPLPFIRPEDRRRSGGIGAGPGSGPDWADTEPACFRSEAFAEDLAPEAAGHGPARGGLARVPSPLRRHRGRKPAFGWVVMVVMAVLGRGRGLRTGD